MERCSRCRHMRMADCHPDRKYHAKNMCSYCYHSSARKIRFENEEYAEKIRERTRSWRRRNPDWAYRNDVNKQLRKKYGITIDKYEETLKAQDGVCKICRKPESIISKNGRLHTLAVDHCHKTGAIRSLLCMRCNTSLSQIEKVGIGEFFKYLEEHGGV